MPHPAGRLSPVDAHHGNVSEAGYRLSEQMFPAPTTTPSAPFVRATKANPLLLNMLPEADGCRPKIQSIFNQAVSSTCGLQVGCG